MYAQAVVHPGASRVYAQTVVHPRAPRVYGQAVVQPGASQVYAQAVVHPGAGPMYTQADVHLSFVHPGGCIFRDIVCILSVATFVYFQIQHVCTF